MFSCFAEIFRKQLYRVYNIPLQGVWEYGVKCNIQDPTSEITHGDVIHPCVRYIKEGYEGHHWWMVYTPLYGWNDKLENPRLCYAEENGIEKLPTMWKFYCIIEKTPPTGYNSDPTMLYHDGKLYVYWRECHTPRIRELGAYYSVVGCYVKNHTVFYLKKIQIIEDNIYNDKEVCPTFMVSNGTIKVYSLFQRYEPAKLHILPKTILRYLFRFFDFTNALRLYSRIKCRGVAIWSGTVDGVFKYEKTVHIEGVNKLYQPWHMDLFKVESENNENSLFAVVQSNEKFADICLAWSKDGEHFCLCEQPLISSHTIGIKGLYKPTAQVVDGIFYLYYTVQDKDNESLHQLYVATMDWNELLHKTGVK